MSPEDRREPQYQIWRRSGIAVWAIWGRVELLAQFFLSERLVSLRQVPTLGDAKLQFFMLERLVSLRQVQIQGGPAQIWYQILVPDLVLPFGARLGQAFGSTLYVGEACFLTVGANPGGAHEARAPDLVPDLVPPFGARLGQAFVPNLGGGATRPAPRSGTRSWYQIWCQI